MSSAILKNIEVVTDTRKDKCQTLYYIDAALKANPIRLFI